MKEPTYLWCSLTHNSVPFTLEDSLKVVIEQTPEGSQKVVALMWDDKAIERLMGYACTGRLVMSTTPLKPIISLWDNQDDGEK